MTAPVSGYERLTRTTSGAVTSCMSGTHDGRAFRLLTILDEYTRECLAIEVKRQMNHQEYYNPPYPHPTGPADQWS